MGTAQFILTGQSSSSNIIIVMVLRKRQDVFNFLPFNYHKDSSQTPDKTKPENETNFWNEINEKKEAIFSQLKNKFSNQERRGQKVFIPAVHVYSNVIKNKNSQKLKTPQNAYLRKSSCPEIRAASSHSKDEMFRNSSLPNFTSSSRESQHSNNSVEIMKSTRPKLRRLQSVEEEREGN